MEVEITTLIIRGLNLALWVLLGIRILVLDRPVSRMARNTIIMVVIFGMGVLFLGALVPFGFPGEAARLIYTAFTAFAAIVALGLLTTGEPNGFARLSPPHDDHAVSPPQ